MLSQRGQDINAFASRIYAIELALDNIHAALATALKETAKPKDKRSQARLAVYSLFANCLSKSALCGLNADSLDIAEVATFFSVRQERTLETFYKEGDPEKLLTTEDKDFFNHIILIFKALVFTRFHYQKLKSKFETLRSGQWQETLTHASNLNDDFDNAEKIISHLNHIDVDIKALLDEANKQHDEIVSALYGNNDSRDPSNAKKYDATYRRFNQAYLTLINKFNELKEEQKTLLTDGTVLEEKANLPTEPTALLQQEMKDHNDKIEKYNKKLADTLYTLNKANAAAPGLFANIDKLISAYSDAIAKVNQKIRDKNSSIQLQANHIGSLAKQLDDISKQIADLHALTNDATVPLQDVLLNEQNKKENSVFSTSRDKTWTTLADTISELLENLNNPVILVDLRDIEKIIDQANSKKTLATSALAACLPEQEKFDASKIPRDNINDNKRNIRIQQDFVAKQTSTLSTLKSMAIPEPRKQHIIRRESPVSILPDLPDTIAVQTEKKPGFFHRHWKALAVGALVGLVVVGAAVASIFTFGIAGVVAAGTIATAFGIGVTAGSSVAGGLLGAGISAAGAGIVGARQQYSGYYKLDLPAEQEPAENSASVTSTSQIDLSFVPKPAPVKRETERGGANDNPYLPGHSARETVSKMSLFGPYNQATKQLYARDATTLEELDILLGWLNNKDESRISDYNLLNKLKNKLNSGYDVYLTGTDAACFMRVREEYRIEQSRQAKSGY